LICAPLLVRPGVRPGEPVRVTVSFYLDQRAWITVSGIDVGEPRLSIAHGDVSVRVGPSGPDAVTEQDARIARCLADQAAMYAALRSSSCARETTRAAPVPLPRNQQGGAAGTAIPAATPTRSLPPSGAPRCTAPRSP